MPYRLDVYIKVEQEELELYEMKWQAEADKFQLELSGDTIAFVVECDAEGNDV